MEQALLELIKVSPAVAILMLVLWWLLTKIEKRIDSQIESINRMTDVYSDKISILAERTSAAINELAQKTSDAIIRSSEQHANSLLEMARLFKEKE